MHTSKTNIHAESSHSSQPISQKADFFAFNQPAGNSFFGPATIQPKLTIGEPGDKYEKQADRVADTVVNMPDSGPALQRQALDGEGMIQKQPQDEEKLQMKQDPDLQRKCADCEKEDSLQMKSASMTNSSNTAGDVLSGKLSSRNGTGHKMSDSVQAEMSGKMGADFSGVHIHTGSEAVYMSEALGARAFTYGNDIYFNKGEYQPESKKGKRLLAHELTHVVQQGQNTTIRKEPASTVTIATVLAWCLSGAAVSVLIDQVMQAGGWVYERFTSGRWNIKQNWCKTIMSALFGCVFGMVSGPLARMIFGEVAGFSLARLSIWVKQKLITAGLTTAAGKWGAIIAKLGCKESDAPAEIDAP